MMFRHTIFFISLCTIFTYNILFFSVSSAQLPYSDAVHINEFLPNPNPESIDNKLEFIELYNSSAVDVDISGWILDDVFGISKREEYVIPTGTVLLAGQYMSFKNSQTKIILNDSNNNVRLIRPDFVVQDNVSYLNSQRGYSYNRIDATTYTQLLPPTPGDINTIFIFPTPTPMPTPTATPAPIIYSSEIHVSEFLPNPDGDDSELEFIELHNASSSAVDVSGWIIDTGPTSRFTIPLGTSMGAGEFLTFFSAAHDISLSNSGDRIQLIRPDMALQDDIIYTTTKEGYSYNRSDNGSYEPSFTPTPNAMNMITVSPTPTPRSTSAKQAKPTALPEADEERIVYEFSSLLVLHEVLPNPVGSDEQAEFIEIKSLDTKSVRLAGWTITDASKKSGYRFPNEAVIGAKKIIILYRDTTKIALNNNTDVVKLIDPNGKIISTLTYTSPVPEGQSWSRDEGGTYAWTETPTPGKENTIVVRQKASPTPKPKKAKDAISKKNVLPIVLAARDQKLPWTETVSRTMVLPAEFSSPRTGKQKIFILLGTTVAFAQLASSIVHKERIWRR